MCCRQFVKPGLGLLLLWLAGIGLRADGFDDLRLRWQNELTGTNTSGFTLAGRARAAGQFQDAMNTNGSRTCLWNDLPLGRSSDNLDRTFSRLEQMALAWASPGCSLQGDPSLASAVTNGLDWMCAHAYTRDAREYGNWWDWEIGGLQNFNDAIVLVYPVLTPAQIKNDCASIDHFTPGGTGEKFGWMTAANLTDKCKDVFLRGIIGKDAGKMTEARAHLEPVFACVTEGDGFHDDGSFIQHNVFAYTADYGIVCLGDVVQLTCLLRGSTWQITDADVAQVCGWAVHSFEPLIYHGALMDLARGRAISRAGETESEDGASAVSAIRRIASFAPAATGAALNEWAGRLSVPPGQYHFPGMDRVVAWRTNFCFGLSLSSSRIANYESINGENLHGWFTGDGMTYLYRSPSETQFAGDFWPTVDAYHLPGTTVLLKPRLDASGEARTTGQSWVGGAQVAHRYGAAGMSLAARATTLIAKKSWFMFDDEVVCLGAGITCGDGWKVDTTVENRRLETPSDTLVVGGVPCPPVMGWNTNLSGVSWCALDGVAGYYFPAGTAGLHAAYVKNFGSWSQINGGGPGRRHVANYLKIWFDHGVRPTNASYAYVLLPNYHVDEMAGYASSPDVLVLTNTAVIQAASKPALGVVAANFWTDGTNSAGGITVDQKASVITWETATNISIGLSDPTQTNRNPITVILDRRAAAVSSADPGVTVRQLSPQIILIVNPGGSLGKSYQASFRDPAPGDSQTTRATALPISAADDRSL